MKLLGEYQNGNYTVSIYNDGTKIRETEEDNFVPDFPECMDVKITNQCDMACPYCHENSTKDGLHGDILNVNYINTLSPYTELALGGGNPLSHPDLIEFLERLKLKHLIANMTVNQAHFMKQQELVRELVDKGLIKGLGVSLTNVTDEFIALIKQYPNAVIHIINGVVSTDDLKKLFDMKLKLLILGYKQFRRGNDYYSPKVELHKASMFHDLSDIINHFKVVSFDNLAIKQLKVKRLLSDEDWNEFYMGDDGQFTMYIDLVNKQFSRSSTSTIRYELLENIVDMFNVVRNEK